MKKLLFLNLLIFSVLAWAQSPIGVWKTIDDETGKAKSHVEIFKKSDGKLYGKVIKILTPGKENAKCTKCSGKKKNQPILGMEILWELKKDGNEWNDGEILDPNKGKEYSCYIELESKDKLKVRGFLGFSFIGRTQYWYKVN